MTGNKKLWKCPNGCNMENVYVREVEILYRPNGDCDVDDIYLENVETGTIESSHSIYKMFVCPVCDMVLEVLIESNREDEYLPAKNM